MMLGLSEVGLDRRQLVVDFGIMDGTQVIHACRMVLAEDVLDSFRANPLRDEVRGVFDTDSPAFITDHFLLPSQRAAVPQRWRL